MGMKDHLSCGEIETSKRISLTTLANHVKISSEDSEKDGLDNFFVFFKRELSIGFMSLLHFILAELPLDFL